MKMPAFSHRRALTFGFAALLGLSGPALVSSLAAQPAAAQSADLTAVSKAIRAITTLKASFSQTDSNGGVSSGTLLLKQPGHIRFDYGKGDLLIVADGKSLNMIDYEVGQVQRWPIANSPLGALLDPGRDLTRYGKLVPTAIPTCSRSKCTTARIPNMAR